MLCIFAKGVKTVTENGEPFGFIFCKFGKLLAALSQPRFEVLPEVLTTTVSAGSMHPKFRAGKLNLEYLLNI